MTRCFAILTHIAGRSSATDYVTDVTDIRKFGNGLCNGRNGYQEEGKRNKINSPYPMAL